MKYFSTFLMVGIIFALTLVAQTNVPSAEDQKEQREQKEVAAVFNAFLNAWLVEQNIDKAMGFIEPDADSLKQSDTTDKVGGLMSRIVSKTIDHHRV